MTPQDVETALEKMGLPTYGTNQERLERLRRNGKHQQAPVVTESIVTEAPDAPRRMGRPKKDK